MLAEGAEILIVGAVLSTIKVALGPTAGARFPAVSLAVPAAIDFQSSLGWGAIRNHNAQLVAHVRDRLGRIRGLTPATSVHPALHVFMTAYRLPATVDAVAWRRELWECFRVEVPIVERPEGLLVRASTHFYNTNEEIDRLADAVEILLHATNAS